MDRMSAKTVILHSVRGADSPIKESGEDELVNQSASPMAVLDYSARMTSRVVSLKLL